MIEYEEYTKVNADLMRWSQAYFFLKPDWMCLFSNPDSLYILVYPMSSTKAEHQFRDTICQLFCIFRDKQFVCH